jgi:hypothetical protein
MTVCIAAICEKYIIIGASDRMITSWGGLISSTSSKRKSGSFNFRDYDSIAVMISGNMSLQSEILNKAGIKLAKELTDDRLSVEEVLDAYTEAYREIYWRRAESAILVPQFLTLKSYNELTKNKDSNTEYLEMIRQSLEAFNRSFKENPDNGIETIIAGVDHKGAQLYKLHFDDVEELTAEGYAVIGSGSFHVDSHFQLNHYISNWSYGDAMLLLYEAKKKAEIANSVDSHTDMFRLLPLQMQPDHSTFEWLGDYKAAMIAVAYDEIQAKIEELKVTFRHEFLQESIIGFAKEGYENWLRKKAENISNKDTPEEGAE